MNKFLILIFTFTATPLMAFEVYKLLPEARVVKQLSDYSNCSGNDEECLNRFSFKPDSATRFIYPRNSNNNGELRSVLYYSVESSSESCSFTSDWNSQIRKRLKGGENPESTLFYFENENGFKNTNCFRNGKGWVNPIELEVDPETPQTEGLITCPPGGDCEGKTNIDRMLKDIPNLRNKAKVISPDDQKRYLKNIKECSGAVDFGHLQGLFKWENDSNGKRICQLELPQGCGDASMTLMEKMTQADRFVMKTGKDKATSQFCKNVVNKAILNSCSPQKDFLGKEEEKDLQFLKRFSVLREKVRKLDPKNSKVSRVLGRVPKDGLLMCLFYMETTDFNSSALNYSACNNVQSSSAIGLGQITQVTLIDVVKAFPEKYPQYARAISELEASISGKPLTRTFLGQRKKIVESLFYQISENEDLQIQVTMDTLGIKVRKGNGLLGAIHDYGTDKNNPNFAKNILSCASRCFNSAKVLSTNSEANYINDVSSARCMTETIKTRGRGKTLSKLNARLWAKEQLREREAIGNEFEGN